jgi:L-asparaginase II
VEVALACASHSGEPAHLDRVADWLRRLGTDAGSLECGPDLPLDEAARRAALARGEVPAAVFNCCSGKHAGFLTVARHLGVDPEGYIEPDHPVQVLVTEAVAELCRFEVPQASSPGIDGCGIPAFAVPLAHLAGGMARLVAAGTGAPGVDASPATAAAAARILHAVPPNVWWLAGTARTEVDLTAAASEPLLIKSGAEGVYMVGLPDRRQGLAIKVADGAPRAAEVAVTAVLAELGVVPSALVERSVTNKAGVVVGEFQVVP